eukprot:ctg_4899.g512
MRSGPAGRNSGVAVSRRRVWRSACRDETSAWCRDWHQFCDIRHGGGIGGAAAVPGGDV